MVWANVAMVGDRKSARRRGRGDAGFVTAVSWIDGLDQVRSRTERRDAVRRRGGRLR